MVDPVGETRPVDMRGVVEALGFEPDNHHNAFGCPYCGDLSAKLRAEVERLQRQVDAVRALIDPASEMAYAGIFGGNSRMFTESDIRAALSEGGER